MSADRPCEVCGSRDAAHLYNVAGFPIVRCRNCGLVFVGRRVTDDELVALYDQAYYENVEDPGYGGYAAAEARKRHHARTLLDEMEALRGPGDLLEIGCAYGYFLDEARQRGWRVRGAEPSGHAARHARDELGLDVSERAFTELPLEPNSLDAVVLWDVIEHLPNPRETLERAYAWMRPGGILALSTGDVESLAARLHGADWSLMTPPWHQFFFSRRTLRRLLETTGLEVLRIHGDGSLLHDPASPQPRVRGFPARILASPLTTRVARRLGAGAIMVAFAHKAAA
jgi:SAM-dependent methyltransferase